jgi:hypothetical protein
MIEELILQYKMNKEEALALRLADIYITLSRKYFPDYKHATLPKKGDPRKCILFKYCWKMMTDTEGKLKPTEYRNYIQAQMSILKNIRVKEGHPYIDPNCLVGDKAWGRWAVWHKYFTEVKKTAEVKVEALQADFSKEIKQALDDTHYALTVRLGELTKEKVLAEMPTILRWVRMNVVSPFFIALSPTCQHFLKEQQPKLGFELPGGVEVMSGYCRELFGEV